MSKESFTPGDWIYVVRRDGSILISIGNRTTGPHYQWDWFATEADARLATASPELYGVLNSAPDIRILQPNEFYLAYTEWLSKARAAIAKARGETV